MKEIRPLGLSIDDAILRALVEANGNHESVILKFNDTSVEVRPGDSIGEVHDRWLASNKKNGAT